MRVLLAAALLALVLAGCVSPSNLTPAATTSTAELPKLLAYDALGNATALPAEFSGLNFTEVMMKSRGGEPNIGVTPKGNVFEIAGANTMRSKDHGKTWEIVFNLTTAFPAQVQSTPLSGYTRSSDPMLWVDPDTGRVFTDHMTSTVCSNMIWSDDEGATWTMKPMTCGIPSNDHQKVMTAHWHGPAPSPLAAYPNLVYYCYNKDVATDCAVSLDGGMDFAYDRPVALAPVDGCGGINGHPAAAPDGTVFVPINLGCDGPVVGVSEDNGLTWTVQHGPKVHGAEEIDPDITVTPDGTAYMLYRGGDHIPYLVRSKDHFQTWEGPWRVAPNDIKSSVFTVITSGDNGRIAMAYLANRDTTETPSKAPNATRWQMFVTYSFDAAAKDPTFVTTQATPDADPVQIGCVWLDGGSNPCRNMLDFNDITIDKYGRVMVAVADGCTEGCADNPAATNDTSHHRDGAVLVLDSGPSLFAAKPPIARVTG